MTADTNQLFSFAVKQAPRLVAYLLASPAVSVEATKGDSDGRGYYVPAELSREDLSEYKHVMDWIERYGDTLGKSSKTQAMRSAISSYASLVDIKVSGPKHAIASAAPIVYAVGGAYFHNLAKSLLRAVDVEQELAVFDEVAQAVSESVPTDRETATLLSATPANELDLLAQVGYRYYAQPQSVVTTNFEQLSYKQKSQLLSRLLSSSEVIVEPFDYVFEVIAEPTEINELVRRGAVYQLTKQQPTPYFGYDVERLSGDEAIAEMLVRCFDLSYELFSNLQRSARPGLAPLAVLGGHRVRSALTLKLSNLAPLRVCTKKSALASAIWAQIELKHPLVSAALTG